jgi:hypothetical protein
MADRLGSKRDALLKPAAAGHDRSSASAKSRPESGHCAVHGTKLFADAAPLILHGQLIQVMAPGALNAKAKKAAMPRKTNATR